MLPAITVDGIIYSHIKEGSYNGDQFMEWLDGLLRVMNPYPARHSVLILDNCRIHHVEGVEERCEERWDSSFTIQQQQPSLILSLFSFPVGLGWFTFRHIPPISILLRSVVERGDPTEPFLYLYNALELVPLSHCQKWFHDSGYV